MLKTISKRTLSIVITALLLMTSILPAMAEDAVASVTAAVDLSASTANKALALYTPAIDAERAAGFRTPWICLGGAENQKYSIDLFLPEIVEDSRIDLFSLNIVDGGVPSYNQSIVIKGEQVYTSHGSKNKEPYLDNCTETVMTKTDGRSLKLSAETWYTFTYDYDILTGAFTATVIEKETAEVLTTKSGTRPEKLEAVTATGDTRLLTVILAKGYSKPLLIDNISTKAVKDDGNPTVYSSWTPNIDNAAIGADVTAAPISLVNLNTSEINVVSEDDYLLYGKTDTLSPKPLKLTFANVDAANLTKANIRLLADGEAVEDTAYSVSATDNVATLAFESPLSYGTTYTVDLTALGIADAIEFTTLEDPYGAVVDPTANYAALTGSATLFAYEDMTGEYVHKSNCASGGCTGEGAPVAHTNANQPGMRNKASVLGHDGKNGTTRATTEVTTAADGTETRLKMTGEGTGSDNIFNCFDFRALYSGAGVSSGSAKAVNKNNLQGIQLWEVKVKLPESSTGSLELFHYSYAWGVEATQNRYTTPIYVKDGGVYRIQEDYDSGTMTSWPSNVEQPGFTDEVLPAKSLKAGTWYTFIRAIDLRDDREHLDRIFVFDAAGNILNHPDTAPWRDCGYVQNTSYRDGKGNMGIGFASKNFAAGEDVYLDDIRIYNLAIPEVPTPTVDLSSASANKVVALDSNTDGTMAYLRSPWVCMLNAENQENSIDIYLPVIDEESRLELFSLNLINNGVFYNNNSFAVIGGKVYTSSNLTSGGAAEDRIETVMKKANGFDLTLSSRVWYTFSYKYDVLTGAYTATVTEKETGIELSTVSGTRAEKVTELPAKNQSRLFNIIGVKGFSEKVIFDNVSIAAKTDGGTTPTYASWSSNFESYALNADYTETGMVGNNAPKSTILSEADYMTMHRSTSDKLAALAIDLTKVKSLAATNVALSVGETPVNTYTIDTEKGEIVFDELNYDNVYTLTLSGLQGAALPNVNMSAVSYDIEIVTPYTLTASYKKANGEVAEALTAGEAIKASLNYSVVGNGSYDALVVLAFYTDADQFISAVPADGTMTGTNVLETEAVTVPQNADYAQIYVWDSWNGIKPLALSTPVEPLQ